MQKTLDKWKSHDIMYLSRSKETVKMKDYNTTSSLEELETAHRDNILECGGYKWFAESGEDLYNLYMTHFYRLKFIELAKEELNYLKETGELTTNTMFAVLARLLYRNNQYEVIEHIQALRD